MLNTTMPRPRTSTSRRVPGGKSRSAAITCLAMRRLPRRLRQAPIGRERIVVPDLAVQTVRTGGRHDVVAVELPVREVGREQEHLVGLQVLDEPANRGRLVGSVER